jgi:aryl-alcohol dehydrogenase-like predicted oxidoreductase
MKNRMINRREFLGITAAAGAALALTPELLGALHQSGGKLIQRAIPSSGEMLPVIGLQFGNPPPPDHAALKEVLKTLVDHGGSFLDTVHQSVPGAEDVTATVVNELGIQDRIFLATRGSPPGPPQPGPAAAKAQIETSLARFKVPRLDLVQVNPAVADPAHLAVLKELKQEGRVRYIGMQVISDHQYAALEAGMRNEPIDFIGVDYSIDNRGVVEETILPLAQERKIGVVAYFPFGQGGTGGLFRRAGTTPLPDWAADFDARTWAQFFLKYVISHPAVTVVRAGTSNAKHMLDNIGGGIGRLPDEATRKRMVELVDSWPQAGPGGK